MPAAAAEKAGIGDVAHALPRLHVLHGRHPFRGDDDPRHHRGTDQLSAVSERENRIIDHDPGRLDGVKKREGYF
jgi:hypothetical protein